MAEKLDQVAELCGHFLEPFKPLLDDVQITDIWRNGNGTVHVAASGVKRPVDIRIDEGKLRVAIQAIGRMVCNAEISRNQPILDARLPDGSRINAVLFPLSQPGSTLSIRKFRMKHFSLDKLVEVGALEWVAANVLQAAVRRRESILVSGATGSGKTTVQNALVDLIDPLERVCIVEDTSELQAGLLTNVVRLKERKEQQGVRAVTMRELVRATLRQAPDRVIVGEVRGGEAFELITAMSTGHDGTLSTIHANSAGEALDRLVTCCQMADVKLSQDVIERLIARSLRWVVHMNRNRRVSEIIALDGAVKDGCFQTKVVYRPAPEEADDVAA